jgi:hypothetical protein
MSSSSRTTPQPVPNIRDTGLATLLITGVEKSQIASGRRSVGISQ